MLIGSLGTRLLAYGLTAMPLVLLATLISERV
jgi:hypothetical protein